MDRHRISLTAPIEPEQVDRIRASARAAVEVIHPRDLLPPVRFVADHKGEPDFNRDSGREARWRAHPGRATILRDFPSGTAASGGRLSLAPHVRWVQTTSARRRRR